MLDRRGDLISHILLRSLVLGIATVMLAVHAPVTAGAGSARPQGPLVPDEGVLLGAYADPDGQWTGSDDAMREVEGLEQQLGRTLAINHHFYALNDVFPSELERWDVDSGRTPLITWEPWGTDLDAINGGEHDALIAQRAQDVAALGAPVFLRFAHEMNGDWYPWSGAQNQTGNDTDGPAKYVAAWQRVHDIFEANGATNAVWVWTPNADSVPDEDWNHWNNYYPGDAYVDWVGIDGYNWGTSQSWSSWMSFHDIFAGVYSDYASRKPIMIAETSSTEVGGDKAAWISEMARTIEQDYPSVAALVWFHVKKEQDWRADSSSTAWDAFSTMANSTHFSATTGDGTTDDGTTDDGTTDDGTTDDGTTDDGTTDGGTTDDGTTEGAVHIADLDAARAWSGNQWRTDVTLTVVDGAGQPLADVQVDFTWSEGYRATGSCLTGVDGTCTEGTPWLHRKNAQVRFTVDRVVHVDYDATANTDPDGDSDGTSIVVTK